LIKSNLRWSIFCTATKRRMKTNLDWQEYFRIADEDATFEEKLSRYVVLAEKHFDAEHFYEFCDKHLADLDEIADEFFGTDVVKDAIRQKVEALYPAHEIDEFTELFWSRVQDSVRIEKRALR
jgi:hypothetical protein